MSSDVLKGLCLAWYTLGIIVTLSVTAVGLVALFWIIPLWIVLILISVYLDERHFGG